MSLDELAKRRRGTGAHLADDAEIPTRGPAAPRQRPVVGGPVQVSLLPRELRLADRRRHVRGRLIAGVVVTALVVGAGVAASAATAIGSAADLAAQTNRAATLSAQLKRYQSVQDAQSRLTLDKAAARVGSSTAIDWDPQIDRIKAEIPAGWTITAISTDSATPVQDYAQGTTPLDKPRAATVIITARTRSLEQLPQWIDAVTALPETADATPGVNTAGGGKYTVVLTVHLTTKAYITPLTTGASQ